ncbi:MAG: sugar phosphate isomerase/epimerase [Armatimonadetes bacterium]|nr:sugar phosphate isomerase/epimerase [Armatimonadota bacterium]
MANSRPTISWLPVRLFEAVLVDRSVSVEDWLRKASDFGLAAVEMYNAFLQNGGRSTVEDTRLLLDRLGLKVSMVTCSPDLTHPDIEARRKELASMERAIQNAATLGAKAVRCTTGQAYPGLSEEDGLQIVSDALLRLAEYARPLDVKIALENHYRDRMCMELPDFAHKLDVWMKLFDRINDSAVMVNLDASNPAMVGESALDLIPVVGSKMVSMHASDRKIGTYPHTVIGEGDVDYDGIFGALSEIGYSGWVSIEDGQPDGDAGFQRSLDNVRHLIAKYWN